MSDALRSYLWLIPCLPLAASALTAALGPRLLRQQSHWPCVLAVVASFFLAGATFLAVYNAPEAAGHGGGAKEEESAIVSYVPWMRVPSRVSLLRDVKKSDRPQQVAVSSVAWVAKGARLTVSPEKGNEETVEILDAQAGKRGQEPTVTAVFEKNHAAGAVVGGVYSVDVGFNLRADALSAMMLVMITFIGSWIAIYSVGYMAGDPGYPRFFAAVALFVTAMTTLVLADNFVLLYLGWEGVGLCSYLLIGFWFYKDSAAAAARKAFLVTRIGDVGLFLGILVLWFHYGSVDYQTIFSAIRAEAAVPETAQSMHGVWLLAALLLFCGSVGKSAQFPLHVWLPDAMEGPTPVSALIHAATMVTAGVYLVARSTPLFMQAPEAQLTVSVLGGITMLLAALIALTQNDLKRVLAYSTLSQLGYMFLALGCGIRAGGLGLVTFAVTAAMFHLFTHAFFKALLFLGAGSVMHAMGGVIDMRRFGGLRHKMPVTHGTFLCGALALAGVPPLAGFWSKDEVLAAAQRASESPTGAAWVYGVLLFAGLLTAGLTAFYTFRAYFMTFWGPERIPPEAGSHGHDAHDPHASHGGHGGHGGHDDEPVTHQPAPGQGVAHESPPVMTIPLVVLAVFAVGVGGLLGPLMPQAVRFGAFLERTPYFPAPDAGEHMNWVLMGISTVLALVGVAAAWFLYVRRADLPAKMARGAQGLYQLSLNKFYIDELYSLVILQPARLVARGMGELDLYGLDALVDLIGQSPRMLGGLFRPVQNGLVQFYALAMVLGLTVFLLALVRSL
jgi:NADH-quinone oxidoreductase subunit L